MPALLLDPPPSRYILGMGTGINTGTGTDSRDYSLLHTRFISQSLTPKKTTPVAGCISVPEPVKLADHTKMLKKNRYRKPVL